MDSFRTPPDAVLLLVARGAKAGTGLSLDPLLGHVRVNVLETVLGYFGGSPGWHRAHADVAEPSVRRPNVFKNHLIEVWLLIDEILWKFVATDNVARHKIVFLTAFSFCRMAYPHTRGAIGLGFDLKWRASFLLLAGAPKTL